MHRQINIERFHGSDENLSFISFLSRKERERERERWGSVLNLRIWGRVLRTTDDECAAANRGKRNRERERELKQRRR